MRSVPPSLFDVLLEAEPLQAEPPQPTPAAAPEGWERVGRWAIRHTATRDTVAKLTSLGVPGYLAWLCTGAGTGYRGGDVGHWLPGMCWPTADAAIEALARARRAQEARSMSP